VKLWKYPTNVNHGLHSFEIFGIYRSHLICLELGELAAAPMVGLGGRSVWEKYKNKNKHCPCDGECTCIVTRQGAEIIANEIQGLLFGTFFIIFRLR
jgi:hypothetical protein